MKEFFQQLKKDFQSLGGLEKFFLIFLLMAQIYYSYRYAFRFGSPLSPPGYITTPLAFQLGKYLLVLVFYLLFLILILKKEPLKKISEKLKKKLWLLTFLLLAYLSISLFKFGSTLDSFGVTQTTKFLFAVPVVFFVPFVLNVKKSLPFWRTFFVVSITYHLIYELTTMTLFFGFGRLPGLNFSYVLPRYGGGWDDPNGFAAFAVLFFVVVVLFEFGKNRFQRFLYFSLLSLSVLTILFGYSITAFLGFALASSLLFLLRKINLLKATVIVVTGVVFGILHYLFNFVQMLVEAKWASSTVHLSAKPEVVYETELVKALKPFFGAFEKATFNENFYLQLFQNYGLVALIVFLLIILSTLVLSWKGYRRSKEGFEKVFFLAGFVYLSAFYFMNLGIPFFQIFPLNLFVWVIMASVWVLSEEPKRFLKFFGWGF